MYNVGVMYPVCRFGEFQSESTRTLSRSAVSDLIDIVLAPRENIFARYLSVYGEYMRSMHVDRCYSDLASLNALLDVICARAIA